MEIDDARALAEGLMREHGLSGWRLVFDHARTRAGVCRSDRREIGLSRILTELHSTELVTGTVLHEIAHALVGARHGHDSVWRAKARALGGDGERCLSPSAPRAQAPWVGTCLHGHEVLRHRRPARLSSCPRCGPTYDVAHLFAWTFRGRRMPLSPSLLAELAGVGAGGRWDASTAARSGVAGSAVHADPTLPVGARVVLGGQGKYFGLTGQIEKRGRTRYHVRTSLGIVTAPFSLVHAALG